MPGLSLIPTTIIDFPPFQLDLRAGKLCRDTAPVPLRPKTFAVLQHLAERPGELVTKQALLDAVWGDVAVSEDVVRISVGELRAALGDDRTAPRFIETVPRRGYRFIAYAGAAISDIAHPQHDDAPATNVAVVGRARERAEIGEWFAAAARGRRQIGFVTGEAGIGKTTLVDTAIGDLRRTTGARLRVARGQCIEQYGSGEPYLPLLEALASLSGGADAATVHMALRQHAPDWLLHALKIGEVEHAGATSSTPEHTLHRLAASLDTLAAATPLVLVIEDIQWSDLATLDLLSLIARRQEPARLLVLCTLRPADAIVRGHPVVSVKRELVRKGLCREVLLGGLSAVDIASYLAARFPAAELPEELVPLLIEGSDGNPFFMVTLVEHLLGHGQLVADGNRWRICGELDALRSAIPEGLRAIIEPRLERLSVDERHALDAASVAGLEFAAQAVARAAPAESDLADVEYVEQLCDALARRQEILRTAGESAWPDGSASARYVFRHALYQQVIYQGLSASNRRRLHQRIGERLEVAYGARSEEVASELAAHFVCSGDIDRAVRYRTSAATQARSRFAYQDTRLHLEGALDLLRGQPETPERLRQEIALLQDLGVTLFAIKGYGDEGGARAFARMREIAERLDGGRTLFQAMEGQLVVHTMRAELVVARALAEELIALAEQLGDSVAAANTHVVLAATLYNLAEVEAARHHAERGRALFDPALPPLPADIGILSGIMLASTYAYLGAVGEAQAFTRHALARAAELGTPFHRALGTNLAAQVYMLFDDVVQARPLAEAALQLASDYDFSVLRLSATMVRGWCDVIDGRVDDGRADLSTAFAEYGKTGQRFGTASFSVILAASHLAAGDVASAQQVAEAALAFGAETGERVYEAEFYRLQGECLLAGHATRGRKSDARAHFERALAIAAERKALLLGLRAATSLCRVQKSARDRLVHLMYCFHEEDDCADLRAARALLSTRTELSRKKN